MAAENKVQDVLSEAITKTDTNQLDPKNLTLESIVLLINTERLKHLNNKTAEEFSTLKKRQDQVSRLHQFLKSINSNTNAKGELDFSKK